MSSRESFLSSYKLTTTMVSTCHSFSSIYRPKKRKNKSKIPSFFPLQFSRENQTYFPEKIKTQTKYFLVRWCPTINIFSLQYDEVRPWPLIQPNYYIFDFRRWWKGTELFLQSHQREANQRKWNWSTGKIMSTKLRGCGASLPPSKKRRKRS